MACRLAAGAACRNGEPENGHAICAVRAALNEESPDETDSTRSTPGHARPDDPQGARCARPLHGFGIARRLEQVSGDLLRLNEGTVYTALLRLGQRGWITSDWGVSERNRKARYYSITRAGRRQLAREQENWQQIAGVVNRVLKLAPEE
jgi:PadR family transcriptional regulator PadR